MSRKERLIKEIKENRWGIILGGVWGLIDAISLLSSFVLKKDLILFFLNPIPYFILYFPMTVFNFFWILFTWNDAPVSHIFKEEFIDLNVLEIVVIGLLLLLTGCFVGYLLGRLVKFLKGGKISLWKEIKENKLGCFLGALWGESLWVLLLIFSFLGYDRIPMIPYFDTFGEHLTIFLPMTISALIFLISYGQNPFADILQGDVPNIVGSHAEFFFEIIFLSFFIGIFLGYSINKFIKKIWRWRK